MAYDFNSLPYNQQFLGAIEFNGALYEVIQIDTYEDGKQVLKLKGPNGLTEMIYYRERG
ncbi:hypothetical protein ACTHP3_21220 [Shouchella rhizosphaerae]|uniref:hypothetical protein n=1 Tax=Shouchella rhizosphaerae TaxID=866786 RepID=UPI003F7E995F